MKSSYLYSEESQHRYHRTIFRLGFHASQPIAPRKNHKEKKRKIAIFAAVMIVQEWKERTTLGMLANTCNQVAIHWICTGCSKD